MGIIIKNKQEVIELINNDNGKIKDLWEALYERVERNTKSLSLLQPGDTQEWWHLIWERLSDAAFVQVIKPSDRLREWIRKITLEVCRKSADEWLGPWFRGRYNPPVGQLETSHVAVAIVTVADLCEDIFTSAELDEIKESLKTKAQMPCRNFVVDMLTSKGIIQNWTAVILDGFGTVSAYLNDKEAIKETISFYRTVAGIYNKDSYGESLQYENYATIHLSHLYEFLLRYDTALENELDMSCFAQMTNWKVCSHMHMKTLEGWGEDQYPRTINFGDSAAIYRPSADILLQIAARGKEKFPKEAGLARWHFEETYKNSRLEPTERATFGFFNSFQLYSILLYKDAAEALTPEQAELPLLSVFETGTIISRDSWKDCKTVLGIQGGFKPHNTTSHRHHDQNSFVLTHLKERFFVDAGHCCYRLKSQAFSISENNHNTWTFTTEKDGIQSTIKQKPVGGNIFTPTTSFNRLGIAKTIDEISVISSDAADVYGDQINRAERIWIAPMPNTLFIIDIIESKVPVKVTANFVINNRDSKLKTNVAAENKLVFRRNSAAMKFFQVMSKSDGVDNKGKLSFDWGFVHDCYHPLPNQKGQGAEGSALIYKYTSEEFKTNHIIVYAIAMDEIDAITGWHIKPLQEDEFHVEPPQGKGGYSIKLSDNGKINVTNKYTEQQYIISNNDFCSL